MNKEIAIERLDEVIKVDTTSSTPADFLATHVPFRHIKLKHGGGLGMDFEEVSEEYIWEHVLISKCRNGHYSVKLKIILKIW